MFSYSAFWNVVVAKRDYAISALPSGYAWCESSVCSWNEEEGHIEEAKKLFKIIEEDFPRTKDAPARPAGGEDFPRTKDAEDLPQRSK